MSPTSRLSIERQEKVFGLNLSYFMKLCFLGRIDLRAKAVVTRIPESNHRRGGVAPRQPGGTVGAVGIPT